MAARDQMWSNGQEGMRRGEHFWQTQKVHVPYQKHFPAYEMNHDGQARFCLHSNEESSMHDANADTTAYMMIFPTLFAIIVAWSRKRCFPMGLLYTYKHACIQARGGKDPEFN